MDVAVVAAISVIVSSIVSGGITFFGQLHLARRTTRREAEAVLARYREPLVGAAYDLQARLWRVLREDFLPTYYFLDDAARREYAVQHTLYVLGQYFAWSELLRREIQFLNFLEVRRTREVAERVEAIRYAFASDDPSVGAAWMLWRGDQRAIGERMMITVDGRDQCIGYADFVECQDPSFRRWFAKLEADLEAIANAPNRRLCLVQNALIDLINELDVGGLRFQPQRLQKA